MLKQLNEMNQTTKQLDQTFQTIKLTNSDQVHSSSSSVYSPGGIVWSLKPMFNLCVSIMFDIVGNKW